MKLWDIMAGTGFTCIQGGDVDIKNLHIDSRVVRRDDLFFCIHGLRTNGHQYIEAVAKSGAAAVVIDEEQPRYPEGLTVLKVKHVRTALAFAAANYYKHPEKAMTMVGVTGTNGKTSVTHFVEAVLAGWGKKTGLIGTVETRIGNEDVNIHFATSTTPDTIELFKILAKMRDDGVSHVVMEVTSHALALHKTDAITYDVAAFTNLTQDHLDFHETMEAYMAEKAKLFKQAKAAYLNADDPACAYMARNANCIVWTYGIERNSALKAQNVSFSAGGVAFDLLLDDNREHFTSPVPGKFTVYNLLATIGVCRALGVPADVIRQSIAAVSGVPGRIQRVQNDKGLTVIVDYAHTPDSLRNILTAVREFTKEKIITVFGCGGDRDRTKRPVMGRIAGDLSDYCVITSDNPRTEVPEAILDEIEPGVLETDCVFEKCVDRREAIFKAVAMAGSADAVVIAGKGHEDYQIFAGQTIDFDDFQVAAEAIAKVGRV